MGNRFFHWSSQRHVASRTPAEVKRSCAPRRPKARYAQLSPEDQAIVKPPRSVASWRRATNEAAAQDPPKAGSSAPDDSQTPAEAVNQQGRRFTLAGFRAILHGRPAL